MWQANFSCENCHKQFHHCENCYKIHQQCEKCDKQFHYCEKCGKQFQQCEKCVKIVTNNFINVPNATIKFYCVNVKNVTNNFIKTLETLKLSKCH